MRRIRTLLVCGTAFGLAFNVAMVQQAMADEGMWTFDNLPLAIWPRRGTAVVIRRGLVGNYMMEVAGQPAIRVRRTG